MARVYPAFIFLKQKPPEQTVHQLFPPATTMYFVHAMLYKL